MIYDIKYHPLIDADTDGKEKVPMFCMPELPVTFDESLWNAFIDHITVYDDDRMIFSFKNGSEITENI